MTIKRIGVKLIKCTESQNNSNNDDNNNISDDNDDDDGENFNDEKK